jgi:hypothetical protein
LWGIGVMSLIERTLIPSTPKARIAASLPTPGPFTKTDSSLRPCSMAFDPADSAVVCAAKGVDFFAPLKPNPPADAQEIVLPMVSVIVMIVLLKVACMKALPSAMFFFFSFLPFVLAKSLSFAGYFLRFPATVFRLPLRVRALVLVLCPRTGSPLLCLTPR